MYDTAAADDDDESRRTAAAAMFVDVTIAYSCLYFDRFLQTK